MVKLVVPMAVCVYIAFTAFALQVEDLGARLAIVVPAAVALTALQILVVATDVQVCSVEPLPPGSACITIIFRVYCPRLSVAEVEGCC